MALGSVGAVLVVWAALSADHWAVSAESVFDRHDAEIYAGGCGGAIGRRDVDGSQQDSARLVRARSCRPNLLQVTDHARVAVSCVVLEGLGGEVSEQLPHKRGGCPVIEQRGGQCGTSLMCRDPRKPQSLKPFGPDLAEP